MADFAHDYTDEQLKQLEQRITDTYRSVYNELSAKAKDYFEKFKERDEAQQALLNEGLITKQEYAQWRLAQMGRGKRFEAMRDEAAERLTHANEIAVDYINGRTPDIFAVNRNYMAYGLEKEYGDISFTLMDEYTAKKLITEQPDLLPPPKIDIPKDLRWNRKLIAAELTSGILQGESIKELADRFQSVTDANRVSAIRNARTSFTAAENAGRQDSFNAAAKMGIKLKKEWVATLDGRTRHSHAMLDGEKVDTDKKFSNGCRFPGDPQGRPEEIYNCRCTLIAAVDGVDTSDAQRRARDPETGESVLIENMSYAEWAGWKKIQPAKSMFTPSATIEEAEKYADKFVESYKTKYSGKVDYKGIDLTYANEMNRALTEVLDQYEPKYKLRNITPFNTREKRFKDTTAEAAYQWGTNDLFFNKAYLKNAKAMVAHTKEYADLLDAVLPNIDVAIEKVSGQTGFAAEIQRRYLDALKATGRTNVYAPDAYGSMVHELGHYLDDTVFRAAYKEKGFNLASSYAKYSGKISGYATSDQQEYIAESFAAYWKGESDILDPDLVKIFEGSKKK